MIAFENGVSALLLHLVGTLPVNFRGAIYKFPIELWIPTAYPMEPPMVYVTPTQDMVIRVGQHVTLEGRVYHHYLAHWAEAWDVSIPGAETIREHMRNYPLRGIVMAHQNKILTIGLSRDPPLSTS